MHEASLPRRGLSKKVLQHRRVDRTRAERIGADPLARELDGDLAGQCQHGAFRGGVRALRRRRSHHGNERRGVDDRAASGAKQRRDAELAAEEDAFHVDGDNAVEGFLARVEHRLVLVGHDAGVVEDYVQRTHLLLGERDHRLDFRGARNVGADRHRRSTGRTNLVRGLRHGGFVGVAEHEFRAFRSEGECRALADAATRAGDQRHFVVELTHESEFLSSPRGASPRAWIQSFFAAAASTNAVNSRSCTSSPGCISGCHCTPKHQGCVSCSIASTTPSAARATGRNAAPTSSIAW